MYVRGVGLCVCVCMCVCVCGGGGAVDLLISFATLSSFSCDLLIKITLRPCLASCQENLDQCYEINNMNRCNQQLNTVAAALYHSM